MRLRNRARVLATVKIRASASNQFIHVDSDAAPGGSGTPAAPFNSLSDVTFDNDVKVKLSSNTALEEELITAFSGVTIEGDIVDCVVPEINGDSVVSSGSFTSSTHPNATANVFEFSLTHTVPNNPDGNGIVRLWVDGVQIPSVASVALVASTPGSYFCPSDASQQILKIGATNPALIYYHAPGSTNPNTDGKEVRVTTRKYCFNLQSFDCSVKKLHLRRNIYNSGPLKMGNRSQVERVVIDGDQIHGCVIGSGTLRDVVFTEPYRTSYVGLQTNGTCGWYADDPTGLRTVMDRVIMVGKANTGWGQAVTQHGSGTPPGAEYASSNIYGGVWSRVGKAYGLASLDTVIDGLACLESQSTAPWAFGSSTHRRILATSQNSGASGLGAMLIQSTNNSAIYEDSCFAYDSAVGGIPFLQITSATNGSTITFTNCIFNSDDAGPSFRQLVTRSSGFVNIVFNNCLVLAGWSLPTALTGVTFSGSRNIMLSRQSGTFLNGTMDSSNLLIGYAGNQTSYRNAANSLLTSGSTTNISATGDFRINTTNLNALNGGLFPDGSAISSHQIGPRTWWDHNERDNVAAIKSGQPSRKPVPPLTTEQALQYVCDPSAWDFYP